MSILEDSLVVEIRNFLHDFIVDANSDGPFLKEAEELLEKLKGR